MIPLEDFFRKPDKAALRLSPRGTHVAWMEPWNRRMNVVVQNLVDGHTVRITDATERDVLGYAWVADDRLVYVRDRGGDENFRLYGVDRDGSNPVDLTPFDGVKCAIVDDLEEDDDHVLFQMNRRNPEVFDVYRLNVHTGDMDMVVENPGNIQSFFTDHDGRLRLAVTTDGVRSSILFRDREEDPWRTVATYDYKEQASPLFFDFDNADIYVASNLGRDRSAICSYDLREGREKEVLFEHEEVDVSHLLYSKARKVLTAVAFETDRMRFRFLDSEREAIQHTLDTELPGHLNQLVSYSRDERLFVVHSGGDRGPGSFWLLDTETQGLRKLFDLAPWIEETEMAAMEPIRYESRDGLAVHGYLTVPRDRPRENLPLVVNPHGGPWARDSWGYNPEVQFLAHQGYAVLQMNFRGSTGYGRKFLEAGFGEWGRTMQDDVTDGVRWAIDEKIADPERVAIYGGSYGGYCALSGLTKTPELYACGVSYVGVSNLFTWIEAIPPYWKPYLEMMYEMVGHPERDEARFRETSPLFHVDRIRAPLFVAQGANDPRVRKEESDQIVEALRERGVATRYLVKDNEGHGFHNEENRFEFYRALGSFLEEHLQPA